MFCFSFRWCFIHEDEDDDEENCYFYLPFECWFFFRCQPGHFCVTMPFCFFLSVIKMLNERVAVVFLSEESSSACGSCVNASSVWCLRWPVSLYWPHVTWVLSDTFPKRFLFSQAVHKKSYTVKVPLYVLFILWQAFLPALNWQIDHYWTIGKLKLPVRAMTHIMGNLGYILNETHDG